MIWILRGDVPGRWWRVNSRACARPSSAPVGGPSSSTSKISWRCAGGSPSRGCAHFSKVQAMRWDFGMQAAARGGFHDGTAFGRGGFVGFRGGRTARP